MDVLSFETEVRQLIGLQQEGEYWDFKKEWHQNKADLLHDIICMANNVSNQDGLIIIGVDEENDYSICDVINDPNRRKTQDIVSFLREKKFAGGIRPTAYVQPVTLWKKTIDIIVIRNDRNTPYYLTEQYQGVFANNIYARIMDTNTPKNASADINIIEKLWKKRFGIDATALDRALLFLQKPYDWVDSNDGKKFYKYAPEFTLEDIQAEDGRDGYEFYLFNQCDSRPRWYDINIYHHQTLLYSLGGVALDGGRCFTSTPRTDGLSLYKDSYHHWDVSYKYFIKDSIEYTIHQFYITDNMEEYFARICASVLPHGEKTYQGIQLIDEALAQKKKTPAEYIAYDFDFFTIYNKNVKVQEKEMLLDEIKELALDLYENLMIKIRNIGNRYEKE